MNTTETQHPMQASPTLSLPALTSALVPVVIKPEDSVVIPREIALQLSADRITHAYKKSVAAILAVGRQLIEEKKAYKHGEWGRLFKGHKNAVAKPVPFSQNNAGRWMQIAKHPTLSNSAYGQNLPTSWRTLYELTHLAVPILKGLLAFGAVHPEMHCSEARVLRERYGPPTPRGISSGIDPDIKDLLSREIDQDILLHYVIDTNKLLREPLQLSEDGRIVSGVFWVHAIPVPEARATRPGKPTHSCPQCGHVHGDRR